MIEFLRKLLCGHSETRSYFPWVWGNGFERCQKCGKTWRIIDNKRNHEVLNHGPLILKDD